MKTPYNVFRPVGLFFLHMDFRTEKNITFVEYHPIIISTKFGSNWHCGFREEYYMYNVKVDE
jgi:hypothetical protein